MPRTCFHVSLGHRCTADAEYVVIGEGLSCLFTVQKPGDEEKTEFCLEHAESVRLVRQTQTPVR